MLSGVPRSVVARGPIKVSGEFEKKMKFEQFDSQLTQMKVTTGTIAVNFTMQATALHHEVRHKLRDSGYFGWM